MQALKLCLVLNGPPNSGKDTLANLLVSSHGFTKHQMKDTLYAETAKAFNIEESVFKALASDRELKELSLPMLNDLTPRQAMIHVSQNIIKPRYGTDYFGNCAAVDCLKNGSQKTVFSDGGFVEEIKPLLRVFEKVVIFHLYKEGSTFLGDSRDYVTGFPNTYPLHVIEGQQSMAIRDICQILTGIIRPPSEVALGEVVSQVAG